MRGYFSSTLHVHQQSAAALIWDPGWRNNSDPQRFWHQGPLRWKTVFPRKRGGRVGMVSRLFKHLTFSVHFISIIITSAPSQIIRHEILEVGDLWNRDRGTGHSEPLLALKDSAQKWFMSHLLMFCWPKQLHGPTWGWQVRGSLPAGREWHRWCSGLPYSLAFSGWWILEMSRNLQKIKKVVSSNEKQDKGWANMYKNCHDESWDYFSHLFPNREPEAQLVIPCFVFNLLAGRLHPD